MSFKQNFDLVVWWYRCPPDEIALMRQFARNDTDAQRIWYAELAREIDNAIQVGERPLDSQQLVDLTSRTATDPGSGGFHTPV